MSRWVNGFVVLLSVSVLGANLWLVKPHPDAWVPAVEVPSEVVPAAGVPSTVIESVTGPAAPHSRQTAPSPFAYIHEDGSEEYLPSGVAFEEVHASAGFLGDEPLQSRNAVYSWSSAELTGS